MSTANKGKVVLFHYTLKDEKNKIIDKSDGTPLVYLHGAGNIIPGLEREMEGRSVGDTFQAVIPPELAYGVKVAAEPQAVHRREFPKDWDLREGMTFRAKGSDGEEVQIWVTKVEGAKVWVDTNHPLAGKTLTFDVEITRIRDATEDEKKHGHPHGPDGTAHHHH